MKQNLKEAREHCDWNLCTQANQRCISDVISYSVKLLAPVVQKVDSAIHRISLYPVDKY